MSKVICNTRVMNARLTGVQRNTQSILHYFPKDRYAAVSPPLQSSRGFKGHLWDQFILPGQVKNNLLWSPNNTGPIYFKRQVVTVHDIVAIDHPEWLNKAFAKWYQFLTPILCKNAAHIITISEFSRQRILDRFRIPESKITVIHNGVDIPVVGPETSSRYPVPFKRYILSLGSIEPRKNIPMLLNAWKNVQNRVPEDVGLVIVGAKGSNNVFKDTRLQEMPERVFFTGHISDTHIKQLYAEALFFVYLSVYEGFGLPPLEAMGYGTAVLTGNKTSLPEVVGDAGLMVDPLSLSECEKGLEYLTNNEEARNAFAEKGRIRARMFTWKAAAAKTWTILEQF